MEYDGAEYEQALQGSSENFKRDLICVCECISITALNNIEVFLVTNPTLYNCYICWFWRLLVFM
jgi:hypothetical protein